MADAKIINYGQQISAGSTAIPDNTSVALDIESTDAKDYIVIDTTDGSELITLGSKTLVKGDLLDEMTGTVEIDGGALNTLVGSGTAFLTEIFEGSAVKVDGQIFSVFSVASNTSAVLDSNASGAVAAGTKIYTDNSPLFQVQSGDSRSLLEANNHYVRITGRGGPTDDSPTSDEVALYIDGANTVSGNTHSTVLEINAEGSNGPGLYFSESGALKGRLMAQSSRMVLQTESSAGDIRIRPGNTANMLILDAGTMDATWQDADIIQQANSADAVADSLIFQKSRHATDGSHTIVQDDDVLGTVEFKGSDGDSFESGAKIFARVNGTPGAGTDMPTELVFSTSAEASATPAERVTIASSGFVGVGAASPDAPVHIVDDTQNTQLLIDRSSGQFKIEQNTAHTTAQSNVNLRLASGSAVRVMLLSGGNVGVATTAPGQIFDVNQGSGNMIADGYDTHSLASYKENLSTAGPGYLAKVTACPPKQWTSVPYVSADEIKVATIEQFGQDAWGEYFPEDDSHRAGALLSMPEGEMKTWIDAWAESRRQERRPEEKWQQVRLGLVADAEDTAASFSESIAKNDSGEISGINTMSYIGTLHAALVELAARVAELEAGD